MALQRCLAIGCTALIVAVAPSTSSAGSQAIPDAVKKVPGTTAGIATSALKASPGLITDLSKELGSSPEQAAGAAGALFGVAKSKLKPAEFSQIASAVPGMDALLSAAPAIGGSAAGMAGAASAFSKLGLKPELVAKAVPVLTQFVTKSGGANVGNLLASALK
jgi:Protein of unknown function VcgC/VcgE (DUF2780)